MTRKINENIEKKPFFYFKMEKCRWSNSKEQRYCTKTRPGTFTTNTSTNADHQHARNKDIAPRQDQALL